MVQELWVPDWGIIKWSPRIKNSAKLWHRFLNVMICKSDKKWPLEANNFLEAYFTSVTVTFIQIIILKKAYKILCWSVLWVILNIFQIFIWQFQMRVSNSKFDLYTLIKSVCFISSMLVSQYEKTLVMFSDKTIIMMSELSYNLWLWWVQTPGLARNAE